MSNTFTIFQYTKNSSLALTQCCEAVAEATSADSPLSLIGKRDEDLPWSSRVAEYKAEDKKVMAGELSQVYQLAHFHGKDHLLLNNKSPLYDKNNKIIGIIGSSIDMTELTLAKQSALTDNGALTVHTGTEILYFTQRETNVLKWILRGKMSSEIALLEHKSKRTIEGHISTIKKKLQAQTKGDIVNIAHQLGLLHITFSIG